MQTSTETQAPAAPAAPAPAAPAAQPTVAPPAQPTVAPAAPLGPATVTIVGADGKTQTLQVPRTASEVEALVFQRRELSEQLISATNRRDQLSREIGIAPAGASRTGLEDRIRVLDQRIVQLETDIAATGRQLSAAPADLVEEAQQNEGPPYQNTADFEEGMGLGVFLVLGFFGVVYAWRRWRRRKAPKRQTPVPIESDSRLQRLEQGMEAIAIEIERVSEGQRFVTKLLSEAATPQGVSHRIAQPETVAQRSAQQP